MPVNELLDLLDILRPPPGCEMPIALARLLQSESGRSAKSVVVDGGAAALVDQLQRVPPSISDTLGAILRLHHLLEAGRAAAVPTAVVAGLLCYLWGSVDDRSLLWLGAGKFLFRLEHHGRGIHADLVVPTRGTRICSQSTLMICS